MVIMTEKVLKAIESSFCITDKNLLSLDLITITVIKYASIVTMKNISTKLNLSYKYPLGLNFIYTIS